MPSYNLTISGFVRGDDLDIERTVTHIPSGQVVTKMWFTVKNRFTDDDSEAVFQKIVTPVYASGQGSIIDPGSTGVATVLFTLTHRDTALMRGEAEYFYDIQIITDQDKIYTPENGVIVALSSVTSATS